MPAILKNEMNFIHEIFNLTILEMEIKARRYHFTNQMSKG